MAKKTPIETIESLAKELQEMSKSLPDVPKLVYLFSNAMASVLMAHDYLRSYLNASESINNDSSSQS